MTGTESSPVLALPVAGIPETEYSADFLRKMLTRMGMSFFKYGPVEAGYAAGKIDALGTARLHLERYAATGNTELLVDAANYLMIEFMFPGHHEAHFKATDSNASLGRVHADGSIDQRANAPSTTKLWIKLYDERFEHPEAWFYRHDGD